MKAQPQPLSATDRGRLWLGNFEPGERADAAALLDSIEHVSETDFRLDLKRLLVAIRDQNGDAKVAAFPVQGLPPSKIRAPYYVDPTTFGPMSGSELIVENVLRKTRRATKFVIKPSVEEMRRSRVDILLFVTDSVGSGGEAWEYIRHVASNPSIQSWISSKHVRLELATHSISNHAWGVLERWTPLSAIHLCQAGGDMSTTGWSRSQRKRIEALCVKYGDGVVDAFGYDGVSHLTIYGHTVGNGLPRILLQPTGQDGTPWVPLLPFDRAFGLTMDDEWVSAGYSPTRSVEATVESLRSATTLRIQKQEAAALAASDDTRLAPVVLLLVCLRMRITSDFQLMRHARMSR
jgi:hypothetical protein